MIALVAAQRQVDLVLPKLVVLVLRERGDLVRVDLVPEEPAVAAFALVPEEPVVALTELECLKVQAHSLAAPQCLHARRHSFALIGAGETDSVCATGAVGAVKFCPESCVGG